MDESRLTYRVVCEDDGKEIEPPGVVIRAFGPFEGLSQKEAEEKIEALAHFLKKNAKDTAYEPAEYWDVSSRLVSLRRSGKTRTYSTSPEWISRGVK